MLKKRFQKCLLYLFTHTGRIYATCKHFRGVVASEMRPEHVAVPAPHYLGFPFVRQVDFRGVPTVIFVHALWDCKSKILLLKQR